MRGRFSMNRQHFAGLLSEIAPIHSRSNIWRALPWSRKHQPLENANKRGSWNDRFDPQAVIQTLPGLHAAFDAGSRNIPGRGTDASHALSRRPDIADDCVRARARLPGFCELSAL